MMSDAHTKLPPYVALLGYGGLIPFVGLASLLWLDAQRVTTWSQALISYGAVILSFVGAVYWGVAMSVSTLNESQRQRAFVWSVAPALFAWFATMMVDAVALLILLLGFVAQFVQDHRFANAAGLPAWYLPLRKQLTFVVCCCLLASLLHSAIGR